MLVEQIRSWRATEVKGPPLILNHATNRISFGGAVLCLLGRDLFLHPKTFLLPQSFPFSPGRSLCTDWIRKVETWHSSKVTSCTATLLEATTVKRISQTPHPSLDSYPLHGAGQCPPTGLYTVIWFVRQDINKHDGTPHWLILLLLGHS